MRKSIRNRLICDLQGRHYLQREYKIGLVMKQELTQSIMDTPYIAVS